MKDAANVMMRELKAELGINAPHNIVESFIASGIRDEAIRTNADLVVTGRGHQQGTISRAWSNLYEIVRETPCPVLSI
jgi:nucleotide-binding universal stress UspA family protein